MFEVKRDTFGNAELGGVATVLAGFLRKEFPGLKVRSIEPSLLQRCAGHIASATDIEEAYQAGVMAVRYALAGHTDKMVIFKRTSKDYKINYELLDLELCANTEKTLPLEWIKKDRTGLTKEFYDYALPLIKGRKEEQAPDLPRYAKLKKVYVKK